LNDIQFCRMVWKRTTHLELGLVNLFAENHPKILTSL